MAAKRNKKWCERVGRAALAAGWPFSLHNERLKRAGREMPGDKDDPDTQGYWDWWPDFNDLITEDASRNWLEAEIIKVFGPEYGTLTVATDDDGETTIDLLRRNPDCEPGFEVDADTKIEAVLLALVEVRKHGASAQDKMS